MMNNDLLFKKKLTNNREVYLKYLKGKRVVVVNPAPSIVGSKQREFIDSFDIVVRLNKAVPVPSTLIDDIGTRTDVLYNCMNPSEECGGQINVKDLRNNGVKFLVAPYGPITTIDKRYTRFKSDIYNFITNNSEDDLSISHIDSDYFKNLLKIMKLPNTGVNAILDLLSTEISELYITGFTFFKGGYYKEYRRYNEKEVLDRMNKYGLHDQEKQMLHMKEVLLNDARVKMDKTLMEIIMEYKAPNNKPKPKSNKVKTKLPPNNITLKSSQQIKLGIQNNDNDSTDNNNDNNINNEIKKSESNKNLKTIRSTKSINNKNKPRIIKSKIISLRKTGNKSQDSKIFDFTRAYASESLIW